MISECTLFTMSLGFKNPDPFARFVPQWYRAIAAMDPLPAAVCVAHPYGDASGVTHVPDGFPVPVLFVEVVSRNPTDFLQAAVERAPTAWVSWAGIDDTVLPDAFRDVAAATAAGADVIVGKYVADGCVYGDWSPQQLTSGSLNRMAPNSPFTVAAFRRVGGWPDVHFHDWGLWIKFAHAGVTVFHSDVVGMIQDLGHHHVTRSGVQMPIELRQMAMQQIADLVQELRRG